MRHTVDVVQLDRPIRQQPQRPLRMSGRRVRTAQRDQMRLEIPVRLALVDLAPSLSAKRNVKSLLDKLTLHPVHLALADPQHTGDRLAGTAPVIELALVTVQKNQRI